MPAISVNNLVKTYEVQRRPDGFWGSVKGLVKRDRHFVKAVQGVSFNVEEGELVAFLGPNGAGKTTTLKMVSGLLYPTGGSVRALGHDPFLKEHAFLRRFSFVMGQRHQLWWELPAMDTFRLNAAIFDLDKTQFERKLGELNDWLNLDPLWHTPVKKLSLGQRMKMELACSLIHDPDLLLLDEPTLGLDVVMQKTLRDFISRINQEKKTTILLTSHNMEDIESLCRRVIVINNGLVLFDGELKDLVSRYAPAKRVVADFNGPVSESDASKYGSLREFFSPRAIWEIPRIEIPKAVGAILKDLPVADLAVEEMPLEDVIRHLFQGAPAR